MKFDKNNMNMQDILKMASTPAGRELISMLQASGGSNMEQAKKAAQAGNYDLAKENLSQFLKSPRVQELLKEMEKSNG